MRESNVVRVISQDGELWKPCPEFESKYLISSHGRIISIGTYNTCKTGRLLKLHRKTGKDGYMQVQLCDGGRQRTVEVHTLVAKAFIPNPCNYPIVNHIDEDKTNNHVSNLEWCANTYNIRYSRAKKVDVYTKEGIFVETLEAVTDAASKYGTCTSNVSRCCKSGTGTCAGYQFRYQGEPFRAKPFTEYQRRKSRRGHSCVESRMIPINEYSLTGAFVRSWPNITQAAEAIHTSTSNICKCYKGKLLTCKGRIFLTDNNISDRLNLIKAR